MTAYDQRRIHQLERRVETLEAQLTRDRQTKGSSQWSNGRLAKVTTAPSTGETFQVQFQDGSFTAASGQTATYASRGNSAWVANLQGSVPPVNTYLMVKNYRDRWYADWCDNGAPTAENTSKWQFWQTDSFWYIDSGTQSATQPLWTADKTYNTYYAKFPFQGGTGSGGALFESDTLFEATDTYSVNGELTAQVAGTYRFDYQMWTRSYQFVTSNDEIDVRGRINTPAAGGDYPVVQHWHFMNHPDGWEFLSSGFYMATDVVVNDLVGVNINLVSPSSNSLHGVYVLDLQVMIQKVDDDTQPGQL